jgi:hypothetical protein
MIRGMKGSYEPIISLKVGAMNLASARLTKNIPTMQKHLIIFDQVNLIYRMTKI